MPLDILPVSDLHEFYYSTRQQPWQQIHCGGKIQVSWGSFNLSRKVQPHDSSKRFDLLNSILIDSMEEQLELKNDLELKS